MNSLSIFDFQTQPVRVFDRAGKPWFVAADVCRVLDIANSRDAVAMLDEDEKGVGITDTLGGRQNLTLISESGLYALIFKSRKENAKTFRKWVTSEVLPQIRKTGSYESQPAAAQPQLCHTTTLPAFLESHPTAHALPLRDQIRLASLCKQLGKALGVVARQAEDPRYGTVAAWPEALCLDVLAELVRTKGPRTAAQIEMSAILIALADRCAHGAQFNARELHTHAARRGQSYNGACHSGYRASHGQLKALGRQLQHFLGRPLTDTQGRAFEIRRHRAKQGARYTLNFLVPQK